MMNPFHFNGERKREKILCDFIFTSFLETEYDALINASSVTWHEGWREVVFGTARRMYGLVEKFRDKLKELVIGENDETVSERVDPSQIDTVFLSGLRQWFSSSGQWHICGPYEIISKLLFSYCK